MNPIERALLWIRQELTAHPSAEGSSSTANSQENNSARPSTERIDSYCNPLYPPLDNGIQASGRNSPLFNPRRIPDSSRGPLGWQQLPENDWVPAVMCMTHSIRALDAELTQIPSNESQPGCRNPEFQYGSVADPGESNVCWAPHTSTTIIARTRWDSGIREPIIHPFIARYDNEPLDPSGRTPLALGRSILRVDGFTSVLAGAEAPTAEQYDFMHPPYVPMEASVQICTSPDLCLFNIIYQFQGAIASLASQTEARNITGFWDSLGYGDLYRRLHYPPGSVDMTQRDFFEHIVRPTLSPLRRRYLQTHHQTYSVNPDLFSFSGIGGAETHFQMLPVETRFPGGTTLRLLEQVSLSGELNQLIQSISASQNSGDDAARSERVNFLTRLMQGYQHQNNINEIFISPPSQDNFSSEANALRMRIDNPAFDLEIPIGEAGLGNYLNIHHLLASRIRVLGPSLQDLFSNPWNSNIPIQVVIDSPSIQSLRLNQGPLHINLPAMRADEIGITLPALAQIRRILNVDETHPFGFTDVLSHIQELLPFCSLRVQNLKIDDSFSTGYEESMVSISGTGGQIDELILTTDLPNPRLDPDYPDRRVPHLLITHGVLRNLSAGGNYVGHLHAVAPRNIIESVNILFPYSRAILTSPRLETEGTLVYDSTPVQNIEDEHLRNFDLSQMCQPNSEVEDSSERMPTCVRLGNSEENRINHAQVRNIQVELDYKRPRSVQWRVDCDFFAEVVPGSVLFPNPNMRVELEGGSIRGAHLHSTISKSIDGPFVHNTYVSGAMELRFAGRYPFGTESTPVFVDPYLTDVTASANDVCVHFSSNEQSQGEMFVSGRLNERGQNICREGLDVPDEHSRELPALHGSTPIVLTANFNNSQITLRDLPWIGTMDHLLGGSVRLGLQGFWLNRDNEWEVDLVNTGFDHLRGTVDAQQHHIELISPASTVADQNHITLDRVRVQGHRGSDVPDQVVMLGLDVYLLGRGRRSLLDLNFPYIAYYDAGRFSVDLPHSRINARYNGFPGIHWNRVRRQ